MIKHVIAAAVVLSLAGVASARPLTNGGFETGDFSGWTQFDNTGFTGVSGNFGGIDPQSGSFQAFFGPVGSTGGISQAVIANPGDSVTVSFWMHNFGGTPSSYQVNLGSVSLTGLVVDPGAFEYTLFTFVGVPVTVVNPVLSFSFQQNPSYFLLDNVSASVTGAVVPLPPGVTMGLTGLAGVGVIGFVRRRRTA